MLHALCGVVLAQRVRTGAAPRPPLPIEWGNTLRLFLDYRNLESLLLKRILRRDSFGFTWSFLSSEGRSVANAASAKQLKI